MLGKQVRGRRQPPLSFPLPATLWLVHNRDNSKYYRRACGDGLRTRLGFSGIPSVGWDVNHFANQFTREASVNLSGYR